MYPTEECPSKEWYETVEEGKTTKRRVRPWTKSRKGRWLSFALVRSTTLWVECVLSGESNSGCSGRSVRGNGPFPSPPGHGWPEVQSWGGSSGIGKATRKWSPSIPRIAQIEEWAGAGMSPGNNESGGKKKPGSTTYGNKCLKTMLTEFAWVASKTKDTYLRSKYHSLVGRRGKKKALVALG